MDFESFVLAAATADLSDEPAARAHADVVEFRMDLADDPLATLDGYAGALPVIATNRVESEGGGAADEPARLDALCTAAEHDAVRAVDVELDAVLAGGGERVIAHARDNGASAIVSAHDFEATPAREQLRGILERASNRGDVGKLAVTAASRGDVLDLLSVTHERAEAGDRVATMAMGETGRHSRAVAPLYGSVIGYAPVEPEGATAPGQFDLATLRGLIDRLRSRP